MIQLTKILIELCRFTLIMALSATLGNIIVQLFSLNMSLLESLAIGLIGFHAIFMTVDICEHLAKRYKYQ